MTVANLSVERDSAEAFYYEPGSIPDFDDPVIKWQTVTDVSGPVLLYGLSVSLEPTKDRKGAAYVRLTVKEGQTYEYRSISPKSYHNKSFNIMTDSELIAHSSQNTRLENKNYEERDYNTSYNISTYGPIYFENGFKVEIARGEEKDHGVTDGGAYTKANVSYLLLV